MLINFIAIISTVCFFLGFLGMIYFGITEKLGLVGILALIVGFIWMYDICAFLLLKTPFTSFAIFLLAYVDIFGVGMFFFPWVHISDGE